MLAGAAGQGSAQVAQGTSGGSCPARMRTPRQAHLDLEPADGSVPATGHLSEPRGPRAGGPGRAQPAGSMATTPALTTEEGCHL